MQVRVTDPNAEKFISQNVQSGRFPTPEAVVENALNRMMDDERRAALTDDDIAAINAAEEEIDRGEFVEFEAFKAQMRRRFSGK